MTVEDFNLNSIGFAELLGFMPKVGILLVPVIVVLSLLVAWILPTIGQLGQ